MSRVVVLIAEDEQGIALAIQASVKKALPEYEVVTELAQHGEQALSILASGPGPNLCLVDINMPIMDGIELIKTIRKNDQWKELPIVVLSTGLGSYENTMCTEAGANAAYAKPPITQLDSLMREVVDRFLSSSGAGNNNSDVFGSIFD